MVYLALDYLDKEKINNYNIHIFWDCKPAIISTFVPNRHLVKSHIIQDIQQLIKSLYIKNNVLNVIWCPGHMGIQGNEIANELAKSAAKQSFSIPNSTPSCSRNFATNSIWREAINRWQIMIIIIIIIILFQTLGPYYNKYKHKLYEL